MSQYAAPGSGRSAHGGDGGAPRPPYTSGHSRGWVTGGVVFAGVLLLLNGALSVLQGIAAIAKDDVYARVGTYIYEMNLTGWGIVHLVLGAFVLVTGYGLLKDMAWARFAGIVIASLSLIAQFLFLPYLPIWSVIMMAIDVFVIWALASRQEESARV
ncbi:MULTISPECIES: hypothetical protein [unclassified Streptomyces]|uniref:DUF7144 family membrane protein n=1 Tax=unclassified Streptomyces TaxID=2593676 RepID=UPI001370FA9D|nr:MULTISPECIES: hypothetical protein [unclassified Streptomyces]MCW5252919.1 hypothetical protein [Streptomyces sp. SHP 1-2]MYU21958.1 hypothetical protein [Streptomyces sp. SID8352]